MSLLLFKILVQGSQTCWPTRRDEHGREQISALFKLLSRLGRLARQRQGKELFGVASSQISLQNREYVRLEMSDAHSWSSLIAARANAKRTLLCTT